jgi:large subunit ribosomal protein L30
MADTIRIKLVHSPIGTNVRVRETVKGLGLRKLGSTSELKRTPEVEGMVKRLRHLVAEIKE